VRKRVGNNLGLFVDFLLHEMAVIALVDHQTGTDGFLLHPLNRIAVHIKNLHLLVMQYAPVTVFEIGDHVGERCQRDGVGAQIHLPVPMTDCQWRAVAGTNNHTVFIAKDDCQRKCTFKPRNGLVGGFSRSGTFFQIFGNQMCHDLGVGLGSKFIPLGQQFVFQVTEILDNAVVNQRYPIGKMRMRINFIGNAVGRPACMADAYMPIQRIGLQPALQIDQLALSPPPLQRPSLQRGNPG